MEAPTEIQNLTEAQEDAIREAISTAEGAWWSCSGGNAAHQGFIDVIFDLSALLGEERTTTPSGLPAKHSRDVFG